jgi:hypothetical protein
MAVNMHLKKRSKLGVKGLAPLGCLPLWGREGVTLAIALSALREGFLQSQDFIKINARLMTERRCQEDNPAMPPQKMVFTLWNI